MADYANRNNTYGVEEIVNEIRQEEKQTITDESRYKSEVGSYIFLFILGYGINRWIGFYILCRISNKKITTSDYVKIHPIIVSVNTKLTNIKSEILKN